MYYLLTLLLHLYNYSMKRNLLMDVSDAILKETLRRKQSYSSRKFHLSSASKEHCKQQMLSQRNDV